MTKILILAVLVNSFNFEYSDLEVNNFKLIGREYSNDNQQEIYDKSQLIGNWFFLSKDNDHKSKSKNLIDGKLITLKADYQFDSDIFKNLKKGAWNFDKKSQILTLKGKTEGTDWKVEKVSDFGMVLINIETSEHWMFAAE